ncbi:acyltransferase [Nocardioides zeae]|uniref:Acyltransferase n=1 Tax=Nocardioides imazamoxiresistens TaxID=3231893 RepID=A0ABU3PTY3_9ACTN|nr:acyltransferase [Nocardioides zeae]MDT9592260.1 acyltransferase [Nocardioides zeae]
MPQLPSPLARRLLDGPVRRVVADALHSTRRLVEWYGAIAPGTRAAARFGAFGPGSCIAFPVATLFGAAAIHLGRDTLVGRSCTLTVGYGIGSPLPERGLVIGDRCVIGARSTITAHDSVTLGDDVWFGQGVFVSDASHGYQDPDVPVGLQVGTHQPVVVGDGSWVGHHAILLPGTRLGRNVVVAAGAVVRGEVPDHSVVAGVPARVVRRLEPRVGWVGREPDDVREVRRHADVVAYLTTGHGADGASSTG